MPNCRPSLGSGLQTRPDHAMSYRTTDKVCQIAGPHWGVDCRPDQTMQCRGIHIIITISPTKGVQRKMIHIWGSPCRIIVMFSQNFQMSPGFPWVYPGFPYRFCIGFPRFSLGFPQVLTSINFGISRRLKQLQLKYAKGCLCE